MATHAGGCPTAEGYPSTPVLRPATQLPTTQLPAACLVRAWMLTWQWFVHARALPHLGGLFLGSCPRRHGKVGGRAPAGGAVGAGWAAGADSARRTAPRRPRPSQGSRPSLGATRRRRAELVRLPDAMATHAGVSLPAGRWIGDTHLQLMPHTVCCLTRAVCSVLMWSAAVELWEMGGARQGAKLGVCPAADLSAQHSRLAHAATARPDSPHHSPPTRLIAGGHLCMRPAHSARRMRPQLCWRPSLPSVGRLPLRGRCRAAIYQTWSQLHSALQIWCRDS